MLDPFDGDPAIGEIKERRGPPADVKAFEKASLAGDYYESFAVNSRNHLEVSAGTHVWIAEREHLLRRCVAATCKGNPGKTRGAF